MAGGTWQSQNKIIPGAYLNFVSVEPSAFAIGDRGIGTMPMPLNWGPEGELIDVYSTDMLDGSSLAKVGMTAFDSEAKLLNLMLSGCYLAKVYRLDTGGVRAVATIGGLTAKAKYPGTKGNMITVSVVPFEELFRVTTFVDGASKDTQTVLTVQELDNNAYVEFSGFGELTANAGTPLTGGTNGTVNITTAYPAYLALASMARWQTMAIPENGATVNPQIDTFIRRMRDDEGRYVTAALANYSAADYEGTINVTQGVVMEGERITADEFTAWVAGVTAGASIVESNTGRVVRGATQIIGELDRAGVEEAIQRGRFVLQTNQNGDIAVASDINSLHTFTADKNADWQLNQFIRVIDSWGTSVEDIWETSFKGKVQNNSHGRGVFKSQIVTLGNQMQALGAIDEFAGADDIVVAKGDTKQAVLATANIMPIVAMTHLYMTVRLLA